MSTKHTPGPWVVVEGLGRTDEVRIRIESESTALDICTLSWFDPEPHDRVQMSADARLIAAAPELLAALEWALPFAEKYENTFPGGPRQQLMEAKLAEVRAALAKVRGAR